MKKITFLAIVLVLFSTSAVFAAQPGAPVEISSIPYTINTPGVYVVTTDLTSTSDGIIVNADNVTIDLQDHTLTGNGVSGWGIYNQVSANCIVKNGTVTRFYTGLENEGGGGHSQQVINFRAINNVYMGIILDDIAGIIRDSVASYNGGHGMQLNPTTLVKGNLANFNGLNGIYVANNSTIIGNVTSFNGWEGINCGGGGCLISDNTAMANGGGTRGNIACDAPNNPCTFGLKSRT